MGSRSRIYISLLSVLAIGMVDMASMSAGAEMVPDENGVMMYDYGGSVDTVYNPKGVGQQGIQNYNDYQAAGDAQSRQNFINTADWLAEHSADRGTSSSLGNCMKSWASRR